jgi:glycosyltransferase involved in cell wall biosynthesis
MIRVAYLTALSDAGGYGRFSRELVRHVAVLGVEPVVLTSTDSTPSAEGATRVYSCLPSLIPDPLCLRDAITVVNVYRRARALVQDCDLVHCLAEPYAPAAWLLARRRPLILAGVGSYLSLSLQAPQIGPLCRWAFRKAYQDANRLPCISRYTRDRILRLMPRLRNLTVLPLGVDADAFSAGDGRSNRDGLILSVGALKPRKGYEFAIRAFGQIADRAPQAEYVIVGRETNRGFKETLVDIAVQCGVADRVRFVTDATDDDLKRYYASASLFVLPSINEGPHFEGFGLVYLEAAAAGLPTIGTHDCGAVDAIVDGVTGFLVPQQDVSSLAAVLLRLLTDQELREEMGAAGQRFAAEHSWKQFARSTLALYDEALAPSSVS